MPMTQMMLTEKGDIQFIAGFTGSTLAAGVTSVTFSGHKKGDFLLAVGGSQATTDPTFTAGWTKINSYYATGTPRIGLMAYKFADGNHNETCQFTGSGTSAAVYSAGFCFRNVRGIGNNNTVTNIATSTVTTIASPSLTLLRNYGRSALVLASYSPVMTAAPNSMTVANGMAYGLFRGTWAGGNFTTSTGLSTNCGIVELLY